MQLLKITSKHMHINKNIIGIFLAWLHVSAFAKWENAKLICTVSTLGCIIFRGCLCEKSSPLEWFFGLFWVFLQNILWTLNVIFFLRIKRLCLNVLFLHAVFWSALVPERVIQFFSFTLQIIEIHSNFMTTIRCE